MGRKTRRLQRLDWDLIERDFVFGTCRTYRELAEKWGVAYDRCVYHGSPKRRNWMAKRREHLNELQAVTDQRLREQAAEDEFGLMSQFRERYVGTTTRMQELIERLLDKFIPKPDATDAEIRQCKENLEKLSGSQAAQLIVSGTDRMGSMVKIMQLLGGEATERIENVPVPVELSALSEAEIERALRESRMIK